jgi:hypothetical protein
MAAAGIAAIRKRRDAGDARRGGHTFCLIDAARAHSPRGRAHRNKFIGEPHFLRQISTDAATMVSWSGLGIYRGFRGD